MKIAEYPVSLTRSYLLQNFKLSRYQVRRVYQDLKENSRTTQRILWSEILKILGDRK